VSVEGGRKGQLSKDKVVNEEVEDEDDGRKTDTDIARRQTVVALLIPSDGAHPLPSLLLLPFLPLLLSFLLLLTRIILPEFPPPFSLVPLAFNLDRLLRENQDHRSNEQTRSERPRSIRKNGDGQQEG